MLDVDSACIGGGNSNENHSHKLAIEKPKTCIWNKANVTVDQQKQEFGWTSIDCLWALTEIVIGQRINIRWNNAVAVGRVESSVELRWLVITMRPCITQSFFASHWSMIQPRHQHPEPVFLSRSWTLVGSAHGSGRVHPRVGLGYKILRLGWVGLGRVQYKKFKKYAI